MTNIYKIVIGMIVFLCLILAACITAVDEALPYPQLPAITVATEVKLTASPAHPTAYLPIDPIPAGERVEVIGTDKNAAWLLVLHNNVLGWMPTFFSRDNVGTLSTAFTFEPLSEQCTTYLDATFAPDTVWNSTVSGAVIALGAIYQPNSQTPVADTTLSIAIDGAGQSVEADYVATSLTSASSVALFAFALNDLQKGSQLHFTLTDTGSKAFFFQAAFFSDNCAQAERFTSQLPVGKPKVILAQPTATPQAQATAGVQNETVIITRQSDSRTPQPTATPTPIPTLDSAMYGETVVITEATASSLFWGGNSKASNAIDGNILSEWSSDSNDDIGAWLELSLPEPKWITGIHIYTLGSNGPLGQPQDITLLFSDSSQQHIHLEDTKGWQYQALTPVTTQSIKLIVDSVYRVNMFKTTRLYEIQLLSKPLPPPQIIAADNPAVSIQLQADFFTVDAQARGRMKLSFLRQDRQPITQGAVTIFPLEQDVAGDWIRTDADVQTQQANEDGFYTVDLPPQSYLLTLDAPADGDEPVVPGWYSDAGYEEADRDRYRGIIFPVEAGKTTELAVHFSRLVVGVINEAGKAIRSNDYPGWTVMVCADALAAVADEGLRCAKNAIDRRGAAAFQVAPGAYHLRVLTDTACYWEFPVSIGLQETKEARVTINTAQPDACPDEK
ncbi:MAG: hypothetical protein DYG89_10385 [Caldilinea sp. CFX5]|nr:hypothetical protein [Caldilinea sp. CFX5]